MTLVEVLEDIWDFIFGLVTDVGNLYLTIGIFSIPILFFLLNKLVNWFRRVLP